MPNIERLDRVLTIVEAAAAKGEHDQANWGERTACGTSYCFAGWAAVDSGLPLNWEKRLRIKVGEDGCGILGEDGYWVHEEFEQLVSVTLPDGERQEIDPFGTAYLDLTGQQANALFYNSKTLEGVRGVVGQIKDGIGSPYVDNEF